MEILESYMLRVKEDQDKPHVSMGEIYYAYLGMNIGSEIDKERPVLIFQGNDRFIKGSNMALVIPITSNTKIRPYRVAICSGDVSDNQGIATGSVLIQQIRSISKARLTIFKGRLSENKIREVAIGLNDLLYKDIPLLKEGDAQTVSKDAARPSL